MSATVVDRRIWILGELTPSEPDPALETGVTLNGKLSRAWVYEVDANAWTDRVGIRVWPRTGHAALLQADGRILVVGGWPNFVVGTVDPHAP